MGYKIAVIGATGNVGREMLRILDERKVPASEVVALATDLVRKFSECFWFRHPEAEIRYVDDARLVVEHLREYGDKRAWAAAKELKKCL